MNSINHPRIAVLIDGENVSQSIADGLFRKLAEVGDPCIRRLFGDFASPQLGAWTVAVRAHGLTVRHQPQNTRGKNAADIGLVIDAMDILHAGAVEMFCIVSSDADFTQLALRLREHGRAVLGVGRRQTAESFRGACTEFSCSDALMPARPTQPADAAPPARDLAQAGALIERAARAGCDRHGWTSLSALGKEVRRLKPDFSCTAYGAATLIGLAERTGRFEIDRSGPAARLRSIPGSNVIAL